MCKDSENEAWRKWARSSVAAVALYYLVGAIVVTLGHGEILTNNPWLDSLVRLIGDGFPVVIHGELGIRPSEDMMLWRAVMNPMSIICVAYVSILYPAKVAATMNLRARGLSYFLSSYNLKRIFAFLFLILLNISLFNSLLNGSSISDHNRWYDVIRLYSYSDLARLIIGPTFILLINSVLFFLIVFAKTTFFEYSLKSTYTGSKNEKFHTSNQNAID